jgi:hypothetical protein
VSAVDIIHEDGAPIYATLDDVEWGAWQFEARATRHVSIVAPTD